MDHHVPVRPDAFGRGVDAFDRRDGVVNDLAVGGAQGFEGLRSALVNDLEIPTIGILNGSGFHTEIVLMCDLTLAAEDATLAAQVQMRRDLYQRLWRRQRQLAVRVIGVDARLRRDSLPGRHGGERDDGRRGDERDAGALRPRPLGVCWCSLRARHRTAPGAQLTRASARR